ncbi:MAG: alpha/beta fold hydrolase [Thermoleophilaceae bacterium]
MPIVRADDLDIHYLEAGSGTPVVLLHGNWATSSWWEPVLATVPPKVRALAPDLRGRGRTSGPDSDYRIASLAADLRSFADALALHRFDLVGHSLGSAVALEFALTWSERPSSLVLVSPAWIDGMPDAYAVPERQRLLKEDTLFLARALRAIVPGAPDDERWERLIREGSEQRLEAALANVPALLEWRPGDRLREIAVPRVVITGALDAFTGGANAQRVASALGCDLVTMDGVGHGPMLEAPERFSAVLWAWIGRTSERPAAAEGRDPREPAGGGG